MIHTDTRTHTLYAYSRSLETLLEVKYVHMSSFMKICSLLDSTYHSHSSPKSKLSVLYKKESQSLMFKSPL